MLCFANPGEIDPRLITTLGVNVKEGPNPIGYFGTGLKYAISTILRLGGTLHVQSGLRSYEFWANNAVIRGKEFHIVTMTETETGEAPQHYPLGFTTDLGKNWQPWMAYRELYTNNLDESGAIYLCETLPEPLAGTTRILVDCQALLEVHNGPKSWLLSASRRPLWQTDRLQCFAGPSSVGFYHGIQVCTFPKASHFTYNIVCQQELTEDRTLSEWRYVNVITTEVLSRDRPPVPSEVLDKLIAPPKDSAERDWHWPSWNAPRPEIVAALQVPTISGVSQNLREAVRPYMPYVPPVRSLFNDLDEAGPEIPGYTCSFINKLQKQLVELMKRLRIVSEDQEVDAYKTCLSAASILEDLVNDHPGITSPLEELRSMNEQLRTVGIYWRKECKTLTKHVPSRRSSEGS